MFSNERNAFLNDCCETKSNPAVQDVFVVSGQLQGTELRLARNDGQVVIVDLTALTALGVISFSRQSGGDVVRLDLQGGTHLDLDFSFLRSTDIDTLARVGLTNVLRATRKDNTTLDVDLSWLKDWELVNVLLNGTTLAFNLVDNSQLLVDLDPLLQGLSIDNVYFVKKNGDDNTASRGRIDRAWANPTRAILQAYNDGLDPVTVVVYPGEYRISDVSSGDERLLRPNVRVYLMEGAIVNYEGVSDEPFYNPNGGSKGVWGAGEVLLNGTPTRIGGVMDDNIFIQLKRLVQQNNAEFRYEGAASISFDILKHELFNSGAYGVNQSMDVTKWTYKADLLEVTSEGGFSFYWEGADSEVDFHVNKIRIFGTNEDYRLLEVRLFKQRTKVSVKIDAFQDDLFWKDEANRGTLLTWLQGDVAAFNLDVRQIDWHGHLVQFDTNLEVHGKVYLQGRIGNTNGSRNVHRWHNIQAQGNGIFLLKMDLLIYEPNANQSWMYAPGNRIELSGTIRFVGSQAFLDFVSPNECRLRDLLIQADNIAIQNQVGSFNVVCINVFVNTFSGSPFNALVSSVIVDPSVTA
jgi:hypothetical protein